MEDLIKIFDFVKDFVGPAGLTIIVIVGIVSFYFSNKKQQKDLSKATSSIDDSIDRLLNSILELNQSNKEMILNMTSSSNDLTKSIITGVSDSLITLNEQNKKKHDIAFEKSIADSVVIKEELRNILLVTHSDLVILTQLHNGVVNLNGIPFARYDIINQTNSVNSLPVLDQTTARSISEYALVYKKVINDPDNIFWGNINEIEDDYDNSISVRLERINKRSLICFGLFNSDNILFAFINIFFNDHYLTEDFIKSFSISKYKYKIENILKQQK